jgi:uncharacterized protein
MRRETAGRIYLGGHSYGGRQASILASTKPGVVEGLLLLSYPLHPPQRPDELRMAHFPGIQTPTMFVHGTRDGFASIADMEVALIPISGVGHELITNRKRDELPQRLVQAFLSFINNGVA